VSERRDQCQNSADHEKYDPRDNRHVITGHVARAGRSLKTSVKSGIIASVLPRAMIGKHMGSNGALGNRLSSWSRCKP